MKQLSQVGSLLPRQWARIRSLGIFSTMRGRMIVATMVMMILLLTLSIWRTWHGNVQEMETTDQARIGAIADTVAAQVNVAAHQNLLGGMTGKRPIEDWSMTGTSIFQMHQLLAAAGKANQIDSPVYTLRLREKMRDAVAGNPGVVHANAMELCVSSANQACIGEPFDYRPEMGAALFHDKSSTSQVYKDEYGTWISAYAPVKDLSGNVSALVEVDSPVSGHIAEARVRLIRQMFGVGLCFLAAMLMIVLLLVSVRRSESEAVKLALVASRTDNAVIITDAQGRIQWTNEGFTRISGYSQREALGRKPGSFLQGAETAADVVAHMREKIGRGEGFNVEVINYSKEGRKYWLGIEVQPIYDRQGRLTNFMAIESDVTQRKQIEQALRESEQRTRQVVDTAMDAVVTMDGNGNITGWNAQAVKSFGWTIEEALGRSLAETIIPAWSREMYSAGMLKFFAKEEAAVLNKRVEIVAMRRDGSEFPVELAISPTRSGESISFSAFIRDISNRKRSDLRRDLQLAVTHILAESISLDGAIEKILQCVGESMECAAGGAWLLDKSDGLMWCRHTWHEPSQALDELDTMSRGRGYSKGEGIPGTVLEIGAGLWIEDLAAQDSFPRMEAAKAAGIRSVFVFPIRFSGKTIGAMEFFCEKTRPVDKILMETFEGFGSQIGQFIDRRTAEAELAMAKEAADMASKTKSEFLANISHEIRTPLNGVIGVAGLLMRTGLTEQQQRYATIVKSSADSLLALINQILDFSKVEAGKLELEAVEFELRTVVEDVVEMLAHKAGAKGLELASQIDDSLPARVVGDPERVRQILINLVNNAIKFTERGDVLVRVMPEAGENGSIAARFSVRDTGIGIPEERRDRLFKLFSQVDASTTRKYGGTGLGLAICKQLVELMKGKIEVESEVGKGSTFSFTAQFAAAGAAAPRKALSHASLCSARVIIVDDNETHREIVQEQIGQWGLATVQAAAGGLEALKLMREAAERSEPFQLAIIDLVMPGMDGMELAKAIKSDGQLKETTLIMLTSMENSLPAAQLTAAGFRRQLNKPLRQSQLFDAVIEARAASSQGVVALGAAAAMGSAVREKARGNARILLAEDNEVNQIVATELLIDAGYTVDVVGNGVQAMDALCRKPYDLVLMDCQMPEMDGFAATEAARQAEGEGALGASEGGWKASDYRVDSKCN